MNKIYMVLVGLNPGIYETWDECKAQVEGVSGAVFQKINSFDISDCLMFLTSSKVEGKFLTKREIAEWLIRIEDFEKSQGKSPDVSIAESNSETYPEHSFYATDVGTSGNDAKKGSVFEFQIYCSEKDEMIYNSGIMVGTNNIGEFLGVVKAISLIEGNKIERRPIYTDSTVAMKWINQRICSTTLKPTGEEQVKTLEAIKIAEKYLDQLAMKGVKFDLRKWNTKEWGENLADYGRK